MTCNQAEFEIPNLNGRLLFAAAASTAIKPTSREPCLLHAPTNL
jgi:hypothetical protein